MPELVEVPVVDLLLDPKNARLGDEQDSQQATYHALAKAQGPRLVVLAQHIVDHGMDPTALPSVVATGDTRQRYLVVEGNRRVLALKALDTPAIVSGALSARDQKQLVDLSAKYAKAPIEDVSCVLFEDAAEAYLWADIRHTGANAGAGMLAWDSDEQDRFRARHGESGTRSAAGQVLDFLEQLDGPPESKKRIVTNVTRLINHPAVRDKLGITGVGKGQQVSSHYPAEEVAKGLRRVVDDLRSGDIKVADIYTPALREEYLKTFRRSDLPAAKTRLSQPQPLAELVPSTAAGTPRKAPPKRLPKPRQRTAVVPKTCQISPGSPRINAIFNELASINSDLHPNASVVLLRVFLELSVDHEIAGKKLMTEAARESTPLGKRLKAVADRMLADGRINNQQKKALHKVADSPYGVAASTVTFNQYVHNQYAFPQPGEVRGAWDELQPFFEELWK